MNINTRLTKTAGTDKWFLYIYCNYKNSAIDVNWDNSFNPDYLSATQDVVPVDYDGDGSADLFNSVPDAVASVANYLKEHGWKRDGMVVQQIKLNNVWGPYKHNQGLNKFIPLMFTEGASMPYVIKDGDSLSAIALSNSLSVKDLMSINDIDNQNLIKAGQTILLNKPEDLYFIGDDNFIAITKYNRSHFYAKAVYDLSLEFWET